MDERKQKVIDLREKASEKIRESYRATVKEIRESEKKKLCVF